MRQDSIQKRKNRVIFKKLFFSFGIFLFTLLGCMVFFGWKYIVGEKILSPLPYSKKMTAGNTDGAIYTIKSFCDETKLSCSTIIAKNETIQIVLDNDSVIFLSTQKDLQKQLASLQLTLSQLTIEGKQFKKLDFRFDKPFATF